MKTTIATLGILFVTGLATSACRKGQDRPNSAEFTSAQTAPTAGETPPTKARGFVTNIEAATKQNHDFRHVLYTAKHLQLVVMALKPGEDIGAETHPVDQFFRIEAGTGEVVINDERTPIGPGSAIVVPAGAKHDIVNTGKSPLQLYTIYAPPHHRDGTVHQTRAEAERATEHFDGKTTENLGSDAEP